MVGSILIVGGYGVVGSRIAADLALGFPDRVVVAGRHLDRAEAFAAAIGHGVRACQVDVSVPSSIAQALTGVEVAVNCIDQPERGLLWAAIERGLAYTDITPHLTALGRGGAYQHVDAAASTAGARILLGAGLVPGISSVMVRALADAIGGADRIDTALLLNAGDLTGPGSFDYLLQELTMDFDLHVDGVDRLTRPYTSPRIVQYPVPPGPRNAYLFPFSDQVLYPRTMGARTVVTRLSVDPPVTGRLLALLVRTGAVRLTARPRVRGALRRLRQRHSAVESLAPYALRVDVWRGTRTGSATLTGAGQAHATATGAAALVRSLADGEIAQPGAWMPEQVIEPARFFHRLTLAGLRVQTSTGTATTPVISTDPHAAA
jgi:saccharopine dehydrogenase-like NADP-dependent oxidoreductase